MGGVRTPGRGDPRQGSSSGSSEKMAEDDSWTTDGQCWEMRGLGSEGWACVCSLASRELLGFSGRFGASEGGMSRNAILKWSPRDPVGKWETRIRTMWGGRWSQGDLRGHISETVMGSALLTEKGREKPDASGFPGGWV